VLLLNAGIGANLPLSKMSDFAPIRAVWEVNYWGCVYPTYYALQHLRKSKGTVAAISSLASKLPTPGRSQYGATKAALNMFLDCVRLEEPDISVSLFCPGFVLSEFHDKVHTGGEKLERKKSHFMTTETCASIIVNGTINRTREIVMTGSAKVGTLLRTFVPQLVDSVASRQSRASFVDKSH